MISQINNRTPDQGVVLNGSHFFSNTLPFYSQQLTHNSKRMVNPFQVLAGSYTKREELEMDEKHKIADSLNEATQSEYLEQAKYVQIGDFPLYYAIEGKNRISLFRQLGRDVYAKTLQRDYPLPEDLELVELKPFGRFGLRYKGSGHKLIFNKPALIDDHKLLVVLPFNESVEFFKSYGVKFGKPKLSITAPLVERMIQLDTQYHFYTP